MFLYLLLLLILIVYILLKRNYEYWEKRGVPGPKPTFFFGNMRNSFFMTKPYGDVLNEFYLNFPHERCVGFFRATTPTLLLRDPELVRDIMIRSFSHFYNNDLLQVSKKHDPILGRNTFFLKDQEWKIMRQNLTPAFTSGKMKNLFLLMKITGNEMVSYVASKIPANGQNGFEAKELCTRLTLNNVATCAFGIQGKCFEQENSEFRQLAHRFLVPGGVVAIKALIASLVPTLNKFIQIKFVPKDVEDELQDIVRSTMTHREENGIVRNDFLHAMNELKKTCKDFAFNNVDVTAQAAGFFGDGYETSSIVMSFFLYEIAANPDVQEKIREEICKKFEESNNDLSYESLQQMVYLDAALSESLRMHPPIFNLQKVCTKPYTYVPSTGSESISKGFEIEEGTTIIIPIMGLHNDPKYFPEPNCFKPERFLDENKSQIVKGTYLPFGDGPRVCLGQRFGVLQIKEGVAYLLKNYRITVNKKTQVPFKMNPMYFMISPIGGIWLNFEKI